MLTQCGIALTARIIFQNKMSNGAHLNFSGPHFAYAVVRTPSSVMTGLRVLLLDNDADALRLATDMLAAEGYTVYGCASCEHAARMALLIRPRVFLFHGCEGDESVAFRALLTADSFVPLVYFSRERRVYEVYIARHQRSAYVRTSAGHPTISTAIRAALLQTLEAA